LAFLVVSSAGYAQIADRSGDLAFDGGYSHISKGTDFNDTNINRYTVGVSGGANLTPSVALIGEFNYMSMPQVQSVNIYMDGYGAAVRFNVPTRGKAVPYGVFGGGGARLTAYESGASVTSNGSYFGGGGGVSLYLGRTWGIRPEFRYNRFDFSYSGISANTNTIAATVGAFFQFGGTTRRPQKQ
jgi:hypothetical protein